MWNIWCLASRRSWAIHHTGLLQLILLIWIIVLPLEHAPTRAHTIRHFIKGFYKHYVCVVYNYMYDATDRPAKWMHSYGWAIVLCLLLYFIQSSISNFHIQCNTLRQLQNKYIGACAWSVLSEFSKRYHVKCISSYF